MTMTIPVIHTFLYLAIACSIIYSVDPNVCPCSDQQNCVRRPKQSSLFKEVFIVTDGASNYKTWKWESVTTVLCRNDTIHTDLMCYTHQQEKKFGVFVTLDALKTENVSQTINTTIDRISAKVFSSYADTVAINLMDIFIKLDTSRDVTLDHVKTFLFGLKKNLLAGDKRNPVEIICVVPWEPECEDSDSCTFTESVLYEVCDFLLIDPSSFSHVQGLVCKARASVPFTKMAISVDEYATRGFNNNRIILGIPWHGYTYTCNNDLQMENLQGNPSKNLCMLEKKKDSTNRTYCDIEGSRSLLSSTDLILFHATDISKSGFNMAYNAPAFNHYDNSSKVWHQTWFENFHSLRTKYKYANDFDLRGVAIFRAEDLDEPMNDATRGFNGGMWNWVLHDIITTEVKKPPPVRHAADVVAGASIGCLILGAVLGVLFTCLALRFRVKKRGAPFHSDRLEYHDEDDDLKL